MDILISILKPNSPLLDEVIKLGDANSATLGLFPYQAFKTYADQGNILIALTPQNQCVGYLLFRIVKTKHRVAITHLCVNEDFRGHGVARKLVEEFQTLSEDWRGISLFSRRDYGTNKFWEHVGFVAIGEKTGRGKDRVKLTHYWYDNQHPNLLSLTHEQQVESKLVYAVIDANVVYALHENSSHPLLADWLLDDVFLCTTPEMKNEINRRNDASHRRMMRSYVDNNFPAIYYDNEKFHMVYEHVKSKSLLAISSPQHESDLKQIAYAVAGDVEFFITQDGQLISAYAENLLSEFGLRIVRPDDLIIHLDKLLDATKYQRNRLAGSLIKINQVTSGQSDLLAQTFQVQISEKKAHFANRLRQFLANPKEYETHIVTTQEDEYLALYVYSRVDTHTLEIPIIRVVDKTNLSALASHLVFRAVRNAVKNKKQLVKITDKHLSNSIIQGLNENSFSKQGDSWVKLNFQGIFTVNELGTKLKTARKQSSNLIKLYSDLENQFQAIQEKQPDKHLIALERSLWPMKIDHNNIPSFLISIHADWAANLFDSYLGRQTLWGSDPDLVFKMDNVYYRSARPKFPLAPSRILWYISRGKKKQSYQGDMSIRACSYVDEVVVGTPKTIFKQFSKLGIYDWSQVYETAKGDINQEILVFRFSRTELFENPISLKDMENILRKQGAPQSPRRLTSEQFKNLYKFGTNRGALQ